MAQTAVISARSGLIHYVEGQVYVGDQAVETKFGTFPEVKENQTLRTEEGRAEVLLTPGVFLRVAENSSFRMITNRLIDTRLEFLKGSAIVEAEDIGKDNSVTVVAGNATVHLVKKGLYRFDSNPAAMKVYDGEAEVSGDDKQAVDVKEGHLIALDTLAEQKFDRTETDALNRWSERRADYVSMANVSAANSLRTSMFSGGGLYGGGLFGGGLFGGGLYGAGMLGNGWFWNPYFGMYTYVPLMDGMFYSPYGYPFFSPYNVYNAYMPGFYYGGGGVPGYAGSYNSVVSHSVPVARRPNIGSVRSIANRGTGQYSGGYSGGYSGVGRSSGVPTSMPSAPAGHSVGGAGGGHH
ncbi:MAG TPA: hypothetical protein VMT86_06555 [Bryobacteraceae bacterium]|nr:hypothetical protein [Bryobacteraceae bacterium]